MASHPIDDDFISEFRRVRDKVDGVSGPGVTNTPGGITIDPPGGAAGGGGDDNNIFPCIVTGNETGGGLYKGRILIGGVTGITDPSTNLAMPAGLVDPGGSPNLLIVNATDSGSSSHSLAANTYGFVMLLGATTESTPRHVGLWIGGGSLPYPRPKFQPLQAINDVGDLAFSRNKFG